MKKLILILLLFLPARSYSALYPGSIEEISNKGLYGFPKKDAKIVCNNDDLKVIINNNNNFIVLQAIVWKDNSFETINANGRQHVDFSALVLDLDYNFLPTPNLDLIYMLYYPHHSNSGLFLNKCTSFTNYKNQIIDLKSSGQIDYIKTSDGKLFRVDTYVISLDEISKKPGDIIGFTYYIKSPVPKIRTNSAEYLKNDNGYPYGIPFNVFFEYTISKDSKIDLSNFPVPLSKAPGISQSKTKTAPEISAKEWLNIDKTPSLGALKGKLVLLEFWATWCDPCKQTIPHLNNLYKKYKNDNFQILSFTREDSKTVKSFMKNIPVDYPVGIESTLADTYKIKSIPHAFLLDGNGKIIWRGNPGKTELEKIIYSILRKQKK